MNEHEMLLLILRNQRAIMKYLVLHSRDPAVELVDQAQETYDFLKSQQALKPKPKETTGGQ